MANEIMLSGQLKISSDAYDLNRRINNVYQDLSVPFAIHNTQLIGDVHEAMVLGEVTSIGSYLIINQGDYDIQIGFDDTGSFVPDLWIPSGKFSLGCGLEYTPYAQCADSTGCYVEYIFAQREA